MEPFDYTKCDCSKTPFKPHPECFNYCTGLAVRSAKPEEMVMYFKIQKPLADKIFELTSNERLVMWTDFKPYLSEEEFQLVESRFTNLDRTAKEWIEQKMQKHDVDTPIPVS